MMWQIVLSLVCVAFLGAILWEKRQGKLMQSASDRKLENVNCLFDAILTHIHAYVLVIDSDFKVLKTNYYDLTHLSPDGKEKRVGDLLQCRNALSAKGGCGTHAFCQECPVRGAIGNAFRQKKEFVKCDVMISGVFMTLDSEERMVLTVHDITSIKQTEEALAEAKEKAENADRSKSAFLANMSHEIRTPLNAIVGFSDVIGSTYDELSEEERADFVRLISINSEHLVRLIDDILDLSKIESNTIKFTYSNYSLKSIMKDIEKEQVVKNVPEIEIKAILPDDDIYITTDATRLKQVICNFINNARKFTEEGYIHFGFMVNPENDDSVCLFVEDTGEGIPQECQKEIFDRFYKVDTFKQGTGLGLSICKTIVEHLQGDISVESEMGRGSRFTVILPFERQAVN